MSETVEKVVLPPDSGGGPRGYGEPDDRRLRKVELEIKIPQIMRDRAKNEKCLNESTAFAKCCKDSGLLMTFKCRQETTHLKSCMEKWYSDEGFKKECTEMYLEQRRAFRISGKKAAMKAKEAEMF